MFPVKRLPTPPSEWMHRDEGSNETLAADGRRRERAAGAVAVPASRHAGAADHAGRGCKPGRGPRRAAARGARAAVSAAGRAIAAELHRAGGERRRGRERRGARGRQGDRRPVGDPRRERAARCARARSAAGGERAGPERVRGHQGQRQLRRRHAAGDLLPERGRRPGAAGRWHHRNRGDGGGGRLGAVESARTRSERPGPHRQPHRSRSTT